METVWLTYDDPHWLARRHRLGPASADAVAAIETGMAVVIKTAARNASEPAS
jgi:hypothetical protein